jgi:hypothetical protein
MMNASFFSQVNFLHVFVAGLAYWIIGALWYMALFSKPWAAGVAKWGLKIGEKPDNAVMIKKMVISFLLNLCGALVVAWFIHILFSNSAIVGAKIGFCGALLAVVAMGTGDNWLSKPMSVFIVDASYHILGLTLCGVIIGGWH